MYVVGFNGPPGCGKDSIADAVRTMLDHESDLPTWKDSLIRPMREAVMALAGYDSRDIALYNRIKDQPLAVFNGDTIRHVMIQLSENNIRKKYGRGFYANSMIRFRQVTVENPGILFVPDVGFHEEIDAIERAVGPARVMLFHVHRPNIGWKNDSRRYCAGDSEPLILHNDSTILAAAEVVFDWIKSYGWLL